MSALMTWPSGGTAEQESFRRFKLRDLDRRQLVEIRDAQASLGSKFDLSPAEVSRLETAEAFLIGGSSALPRHES